MRGKPRDPHLQNAKKEMSWGNLSRRTSLRRVLMLPRESRTEILTITTRRFTILVGRSDGKFEHASGAAANVFASRKSLSRTQLLTVVNVPRCGRVEIQQCVTLIRYGHGFGAHDFAGRSCAGSRQGVVITMDRDLRRSTHLYSVSKYIKKTFSRKRSKSKTVGVGLKQALKFSLSLTQTLKSLQEVFSSGLNVRGLL